VLVQIRATEVTDLNTKAPIRAMAVMGRNTKAPIRVMERMDRNGPVVVAATRSRSVIPEA